MSESNCPICYAALEVREVAPCWDCGADPAELDHLAKGRHKYAEYSVLDANIILCDFCEVDFWAYDPAYFGRGPGFRPGRDMVFVRDIVAPQLARDKYCPHCGRRFAFLRFLAKVREGR